MLDHRRMMELAEEAAELGFSSVGVAGGEPFLLPEMPELLARLAGILPVLALINATLFTERLLARVAPLAGLRVSLQVSLDSADPQVNDRERGAGTLQYGLR